MLDIRFTLPAAPFVLPAAAIALTVLVFRSRQQGRGVRRSAWQALLVAYLAAVACVTLFPLQVVVGKYAGGITFSSLQYVPLLTLDARTFVLNVVLFVPLGLLLPLATRFHTIRSVTLCGALLSLGIEVIQLATSVLLSSGRAADVNDLIANTAGTVIGLSVLAMTRRRAVDAAVEPH